MHLKNFDMNLLVALDTLLSECNVTRAAERLCVSQPAMSNALQRIRDHFDDPVLVRSGREMQRTALAETLVEPIRTLILQAEAILKGESRFDPATAERTLRVSMSDYCCLIFAGLLMELLAPGGERPGGWTGLSYRRLHGSPRVYSSSYERERLEGFALDIAEGSTGASWWIFDNTASGAATTDAVSLQTMVSA